MLYPAVSTYHFHHAAVYLQFLSCSQVRHSVLSQEPLCCSQCVINPALGPGESLEKVMKTRCSGWWGGGAQMGPRYRSKGTVTRTLVWQYESPVSLVFLLTTMQRYCRQCVAPPCTMIQPTMRPQAKFQRPLKEDVNLGKRGKGAASQTDIRVEQDRA
jgi:hypothetical protein